MVVAYNFYMKITKYPQSCLLLEKDGKRILIDPGNFVAKKYTPKDVLPLDGVLITHRHADHADADFINELAQAGVTIIANRNTTEILGDVISEIIDDGGELELGGFKVRAHELAHCLMVDGANGPQNTGYIIDEIFFHPGDGVKTAGVEVQAAAVPIAGPDVSPHDSYAFIELLGAQTIIPVHYDYFPASPEFFKQTVARFNQEVRVIPLKDEQSVEIEASF